MLGQEAVVAGRGRKWGRLDHGFEPHVDPTRFNPCNKNMHRVCPHRVYVQAVQPPAWQTCTCPCHRTKG